MGSASVDLSSNNTNFAIQNRSEPAFFVQPSVNGSSVNMELDTGSANTVISDKVWHAIGEPSLNSAPQLPAYGGFKLPVKGSTQVHALSVVRRET